MRTEARCVDCRDAFYKLGLPDGGRSRLPAGWFLAEIAQLSIKVFLKRLAALGNKEESRAGAMSITKK